MRFSALISIILFPVLLCSCAVTATPPETDANPPASGNTLDGTDKTEPVNETDKTDETGKGVEEQVETDRQSPGRVPETAVSGSKFPELPKTLQYTIARTDKLTAPLPATAADGNSLTYTLNEAFIPYGGSVEIDTAAGTFTYTPKSWYYGHEIFKLIATDSNNVSAETRIVVTVTGEPSDTVYYVSGEGSDDNNGLSEETAFRTVQKAHDAAMPGNTILIMNGTYGKTSGQAVVTITRSGLPGHYITYKAYPGHTPVLNAVDAWNTVLVESSSYIKIEGLKIEGNNDNITSEQAMTVYDRLVGGDRSGSAAISVTNTNGIAGRPAHKLYMGSGNEDRCVYPHHIEVRNCEVSGVASGGITFEQSDYLIFENNYIHDVCRWDSHAGSGINIYGAFDIDTNYDEYKIIIRNNISVNNVHWIPWYITKDISDGNGIIIDDTRHVQVMSSPYPYAGKILVTNNLVYGNGGSGIHSFSSENVDIINNTSYMNNVSPKLNWGEIFAHESSNCNIYNNIAYVRTGNRTNMSDRNSGVVYDYNIFFNGGRAPESPGENDRVADPCFTAPEFGDFTLLPGSPAIGAANPHWAEVVGNNTGNLGYFAHVGLLK